MTEYFHKPVLLNEVVKTFNYLIDRKDPIFVDGTIGLAGHSTALILNLKSQSDNLKVIGIDKDKKALDTIKSQIAKHKSQTSNMLFLVHDDFANFKKIVQSMNISYIDGVLLDLGVSSMQLDDKDRGFSFQDKAMPLDMRMDQGRIKTAGSILCSYSQTELEKMLSRGEEKWAKIIAKNIVDYRKNIKINTVADLLNILKKSIPLKIQKTGKTHFATATFRALRIEVNNELDVLEQSIYDIIKHLKPASRLAIITFHSLEDRIVKQTFKKLLNPCTCPPKFPICTCNKVTEIRQITKKPIVPSNCEISENPRSRSAKLRVIEKL